MLHVPTWYPRVWINFFPSTSHTTFISTVNLLFKISKCMAFASLTSLHAISELSRHPLWTPIFWSLYHVHCVCHQTFPYWSKTLESPKRKFLHYMIATRVALAIVTTNIYVTMPLKAFTKVSIDQGGYTSPFIDYTSTYSY